jgi:hypothetical protein
MLVYKKNNSATHLHVIPVMKCGCVLGIHKKEVGNTKRDGYTTYECKFVIVSEECNPFSSEHDTVCSILPDCTALRPRTSDPMLLL